MKPTLHALEYANNRCTKFPTARFRLQGCHHQGVFIIIKAVLSKWSNVCSSVAYNRPFQKQCFNYYTDSLMIATMECRNLYEEILCICTVHIPVQVRVVL